ncbi:alpha-aminoadipic semialdehyde synthase, mitochondrial-like [Paramormyrops kingsleyae]|uniref:alpha-aminoadipic semialdehyde synthase, mitochondrial-like n=1 Tax=Paramormyrops kingsleyae TaxID=1676925 RepID=UPI003B96CF77
MDLKKRVLLLGSGYVAAPAIEYLTLDPGTQVTVASVMMNQAEKLAARYPNTTAVMLDVTSQQSLLESLVKDHDVVISLLPYQHHAMIAEHCIRKKVNLVTASYVCPALRELQSRAEEAGITMVCEMGLDPGIDHMLAMECIDQAKEEGCTVESYISYCGGLPAPESAGNPLRYKFSWSPRGVLLNTLNPATFVKDNKVMTFPPGGALLEAAAPMDFMPGFDLEGLPNRDSTTYARLYGIESAHTVLRGSLRYRGFSGAISGFVKLGLITTDPFPAGDSSNRPASWKDLISHLIGVPASASTEAFHDAVCDKLGRDQGKMEVLKWFGMLGDNPLPQADSVLEAVTKHLEAKLHFEPGERDMVILRNEVGVRGHGGELETRRAELLLFGEPGGHSAMARTVGFPAAIVARMLMDGEIERKGLVLPLSRSIYGPVLQRLSARGLCISRTCPDTGEACRPNLRHASLLPGPTLP